MSGPCSMCQHFSMDNVEAAMAAGGWGRCLERGAGVTVYQSQAAACDFSPVRFLAHELPEDDDQVPPPLEAMSIDDLDLPEEISFG